MRIALVRPPFIEVQTGAPIGLAYIQGALCKDHNVRMFDLSRDVSAHAKFTCGQFTRNFTLKKPHPAHTYADSNLVKYCSDVLDFKPDVIGFHLAYSTTEYAMKMIKKINSLKGGRAIKIIAGGPDATYKSSELFETGLFDSIVEGYGEEAVKDSLKALGIFEKPLDSSVDYVPDYTGIELDLYGGKIPILTTRGCPHSCRFCSQHLRYYYHDINSVTEQIKSMPKKCGIMLNDSNINVNPKRTKNLFSSISKVIGQRYIHAFGFEVSDKFDVYAEEYAKCNIKEARIGIESGSPTVRADMNKPKFTNQDVRKMIRKMTAAGTTVWAQFIFCYPSETDEDRSQTVQLMRKIVNENPKGKVRVYWFRFVVHHGTEDFFREQYGVETADIRDWHNESYTPEKIIKLAEIWKFRLPNNANIYL